MNDNNERIERLLSSPCHVIDLLPHRVMRGSDGKFFEVEKYYLEGSGAEELRKKFADVLLKLNCFYGFEVFVNYADEGIANPDPERLSDMIVRDRVPVSVLLLSEDVLITLEGDDTHMTVYNASGDVTELLCGLASANGLFLWKSEE